MWYLYILKCKDQSFYVGITNNLKKRLREHNTGKGCKYTKYRYPVKLVYLEKYANTSLAMKRECEIKGWNREKKMELIERKSHL
jgi:putative endonuclease